MESQLNVVPENLITLAHFSVSSAISLPKSAAEPATTVLPPSARRAATVGIGEGGVDLAD